eukprot:TRINITY_DN1609_c0_g1_i1.p1 TRINITY_DN1609_c0_g1~~TRINITY_DN1609_c0_g1_i1.p1  ORF type:complete len:712 (-),score=90.34 TRINITY_DN1609_c0_g1_i1:19-2154(-)
MERDEGSNGGAIGQHHGAPQRDHHFDVLIVMDFEATCDQGDNPKVTRDNQEIIEFPWVVLDLQSGEQLDQQQLYVKPEWSQEITPFCSNMTGITWEDVKDAPPLAEAMARFDAYVEEQFASKDITYCILTDGIWDLKACLLRETKKKEITREAHYTRFYNLKAEYAKARGLAIGALGGLGIIKPSLKTMVQELGLQWEGRHHSGLDDCMNICNVVSKLLEYNHVFLEPETIEEDYDPDTDTLVGDYNRNLALFLRLPEGSTEETTCVVLRGLPWGAREEDIINFFEQDGNGEGHEAGIVDGGVHIVHNKNNRPSGIAYVEFVSPQHCAQALTKNKAYMGQTGRYIEVYPSDASKMDTVLQLERKWETQTESNHDGLGGDGESLSLGGDYHNTNNSNNNNSSSSNSNSNYSNNHHHTLPFEIRQGDWYCPHCGEHQYATRNVCRRCSTRKPGYMMNNGRGRHGGARGGVRGFPRGVSNHQFPPLPFAVPRGGRGGPARGGGGLGHSPIMTHHAHFHPHSHSHPHPHPTQQLYQQPHSGMPMHHHQQQHPVVPFARPLAPAHFEVRPGDWTCPNCHDINFASRTVCRKCNTDASLGTPTVPATLHNTSNGHPHTQPSPFGGVHNSTQPLPSPVHVRGGRGAYQQARGAHLVPHHPHVHSQPSLPHHAHTQHPRPIGAPLETRSGDWLCVPCNEMNFASRTACRRCRQPNPLLP